MKPRTLQRTTHTLDSGNSIDVAPRDLVTCYKIGQILFVPHRHPDQRGLFAFPGIKKGELGFSEKFLKSQGAKPVDEYLYL